MELESKSKELAKLERNMKITKLKEYNVQLDLYEQECKRLKNTIKEITSPPTAIGKLSNLELSRLKQLIKFGLLEGRIDLKKLIETMFEWYDDNEDISMKEILKLLEMSRVKLEVNERLAQYLVCAKDSSPYSHASVAIVKRRFNSLMGIKYSLNDEEYMKAKNSALKKMEPKIEEIKRSFISHTINLNNMKLFQWNPIIEKAGLNLTELEQDIVTYIAFCNTKDLNSLSLQVIRNRNK